MTKFKIIYFDLDGVLANFEKGVLDTTGADITGQSSFADKELKDKVFKNPEFFLNLEVMTKAKYMVDHARQLCDNIQILTATGHSASESVAQQKVEWAANHFPGIAVNHVYESDMKAKFCWPYDGSMILIDDRKVKSIDPWTKQGGTGIHHTSVESTIVELNRLFK